MVDVIASGNAFLEKLFSAHPELALASNIGFLNDCAKIVGTSSTGSTFSAGIKTNSVGWNVPSITWTATLNDELTYQGICLAHQDPVVLNLVSMKYRELPVDLQTIAASCNYKPSSIAQKVNDGTFEYYSAGNGNYRCNAQFHTYTYRGVVR